MPCPEPEVTVRNLNLTALIVVAAVAFGLSCSTAAKADVPLMTKEQLKPLLGRPSVIVIDVRSRPAWKRSDVKIPGAVREEPMKVPTWIHKYETDKTMVLYCDCPSEETSNHVGRQLLQKGFKDVYALKGGWKEWVEANYPLEPK